MKMNSKYLISQGHGDRRVSGGAGDREENYNSKIGSHPKNIKSKKR